MSISPHFSRRCARARGSDVGSKLSDTSCDDASVEVAAPAPSSSEHEFVAVRWSSFAGSRLLSVLQVVRDGRSALSRSVHRDSSWPTSGASSSPSSRRKLRPLAWRESAPRTFWYELPCRPR